METAARFDDYHSPAGRRRAWRELVLYDHGFLRAAYANFHTVSPGRLYRAAQPGPQNLARLNPAIDQSEIKNLQTHQTELEEALVETRFRLDSLHLVVCEN